MGERMENCLCYAWLIPLVTALPCVVAWLLTFASAARDDAVADTDRHEPPPILGLTPQCRAALDRCADAAHERCSDPRRLRSLSVAALQSKLEAATFEGETPPSHDVYATWP